MIGPDEQEIVGGWTFAEGKMSADEEAIRIRRLVREHLVEVARDASGWDVLYRDPDDDRYWELTYPQSEMHGGGPPKLTCLSNEEVSTKYGDAALAK